jgi:tetratricopeptide (TPR) repeat protein
MVPNDGHAGDARTAEQGSRDGDMQQWLRLAHTPPARNGNTYDIFISYRSSDRVWAMALYDALRLAGWEPFLDQYDLVPGANLETSLIEALEASSAGVILYSSRTKSSEWCRREREAMRTLKDRGKGFAYVFAKLDREELPLFALADLYVDFQDSPEGPRGVNLLRLIAGLRAVPLAPEAVRLAQEVDEGARQALIAIAAAVEAQSPERLLDIGFSGTRGVVASPAPILAAAQGLISMNAYVQALSLLDRALVHFPRSLRARQLRGLALRRLRRFQEAVEVLTELVAEGHQDPETLGILAAAWDGRYQESGKTLYLRKSRELYRTAFQGDPTNYYTGINAASKSLFLGEASESARLAGLVLPLVESARDGKDLWAGCTLAELHLLRRDLDAASIQYQQVIDTHPTKVGDLGSTREQAQRICEKLGLTEEETRRVMAPFQLLDG